MQVISRVSEEQNNAIVHFLNSVNIDFSCAETECPLYISITLYARTSYSRVVIANNHSNIVEIMKNGEAIVKKPIVVQSEENLTDHSCLNLHDIFVYADHVDLDEVKDLLDMQISYNMAICEKGLSNEYGANIGKILLSESVSDAKTVARAYAAAGSDARMSGCEMPVAFLCGSGNQGITATVPVICYARQYAVNSERLYRALILSDLLTVYQKDGVGRLSEFCGAVSAGCSAGAAIAYLLGGDEAVVAKALVNALSLISGTFCDGAKPSCAAKIAAAVETGILGYQMFLHQQQFSQYDSITVPNVDEIIRNIGRNASEGMVETDHTRINIMQPDCK